MKTRFLTVTLMLGALLLAGLGERAYADASAGWHTSWDKAVAESKKTGKPILADFTGSDWCGWCIRLKKEVFDTDKFKTWASKKVVLLELDFPRRTEQSEALKEQNQGLAEKYGIQGFPTILFLDAKGEVLGQYGYDEGGPEVWTGKAEELLKGSSKQ